jgi:hypothetical protein
MVISRLILNSSGQAISIENNEQSKVLVVQAESDLSKSTIDGVQGAVVLRDGQGQTKKLPNGLLISQQGEYEVSEMFISAQSAVDSGELDIVEVEADGVRVLLVSTAQNLPKEILSDLGVIDVLVLQLVNGSLSEQLKIVNTVDPQLVIPVGAQADVDKFKTELGVTFQPEKKLKLKSADFENEDFVLRGIELG